MTPEAEELKRKLQEWRDWMHGADEHSILNQIYRMLQDDAAFRVINECRRLAPAAPEGGVQLNGLVHKFIDRCYFRQQPLAIRRLCEGKPKKPDLNKSVISLGWLLDDIKENANLITRSAFLEVEGLEYDYSASKNADMAESWRLHIEAIAKGENPAQFSAIPQWEIAEELHNDFDHLSGTDPATRQPTNALDPDIVTELSRMLDVCQGVEKYVDKRVAHAADPNNRERVPDEAKTVCLAKIWNCEKTICRVAEFVSAHILRTSEHPMLPVPQYKQFLYIEKPLAREEDVQQLRDLWHRFTDETYDWCKPWWPKGW